MEAVLEQKAVAQTVAGQCTGGQAVILSLIEAGVEVIFGYPGGAIMPVYDALFDHLDRINHVLVRHEQGAGHAAEGYARACGKPGVCLVTSGPGATNLVTAITDAMMDSVPMVCIIGQVPAGLLGTDAFQETDIISMTIPVTKWNFQVTTADEIPGAIAKAFYLASHGRPGPVLLDITKNAQLEKLSQPFHYQSCTHVFHSQPKAHLNPAELAKAAELLNGAKAPYIFAGHGVLISGAEDELLALADKTGAPVACTLHGLSAFPTGHPNYTGMLGMHGSYAANLLTDAADVILAVGMRFDDRVTGNLRTYARQAKIIHIEIDPAEVNKNMAVAAALRCDAREALSALLPLLAPRSHPEWRARFRELDAVEQAKVIDPQIHPVSGGIKMGEVVHLLSEMTQGESLVVSDVGQHQMMAARYYQFRRSRSFISSGGLGTMGFAIPAAIGAQIACPDRQVVAIIGDGCFQMTLQELGTIWQNRLPVKLIILNNEFLGMVRQWQELFFERRYSFTELQNPDFIAIAAGFGIPGRTVEHRSDLREALADMLAAPGASLLNILVEKEANVFPMVPGGGSVQDIRLE